MFLAQLTKERRRRIQQLLACVILAGLSLTLLPSLNAATIAPMQSRPKFANWAEWQAYMTEIPTPRAGCFTATYPNPVWQQTQCASRPIQPETIGNGNDEVVKSSGTLIGGVLAGFTSVSGVTSEADSVKGSNYYSLQLNTNGQFPVTYYGKSTTGWEQFVYENTPTQGKVFISYWLHGYHEDYGNCPPASQDPPGGGSGWITPGSTGKSCFFNTSALLTPTVPPADLSGLSMSAYANSVYSGPLDQVTLCVPFWAVLQAPSRGSCYALSVTDTVLNLYQNWVQSEFNIFGTGNGSQAVFNSEQQLLS